MSSSCHTWSSCIMSFELSVSTSSFTVSSSTAAGGALPRVVAAVPKECEGIRVDGDKIHYRGLRYMRHSRLSQ